MARKKSPLEPSAGSRKRAYNMDGMTNISVAPDPLRQIENEAIRDLSNEYRQLRIEEMIAKKRKQLTGSTPSSNTQSQKEYLENYKIMMEIAKMNQPKDQPDKTLDYLAFFNTLIKQYQGSTQPSFFDEYIKARELGIFGSQESGEHNQFSVELEKIRGERMLTGKKFDLELHKMRLEAEAKQNTIGMLTQIAAPILAIAGGKMAVDMQEKGMDHAGKILKPGNPSQTGYQKFLEKAGIVNPNSLQGETAEMKIMCNCGYDKMMLVPVPPPSTLTCPGCGATLLTGTQPGSTLGTPSSIDAELKKQWGENK